MEATPPQTYIRATCIDWDRDAGHAWPSFEGRLAEYERAKEALKGALRSCICPRVDAQQGASCAQLVVLSRRIGSSSADAEVYETIVSPREDGTIGQYLDGSDGGGGSRMAVKVLSIVADDSANRSNAEMRIAQAASDLVQRGSVPTFRWSMARPTVTASSTRPAACWAQRPGSMTSNSRSWTPPRQRADARRGRSRAPTTSRPWPTRSQRLAFRRQRRWTMTARCRPTFW